MADRRRSPRWSGRWTLAGVVGWPAPGCAGVSRRVRGSGLGRDRLAALAATGRTCRAAAGRRDRFRDLRLRAQRQCRACWRMSSDQVARRDGTAGGGPPVTVVAAPRPHPGSVAPMAPAAPCSKGLMPTGTRNVWWQRLQALASWRRAARLALEVLAGERWASGVAASAQLHGPLHPGSLALRSCGGRSISRLPVSAISSAWPRAKTRSPRRPASVQHASPGRGSWPGPALHEQLGLGHRLQLGLTASWLAGAAWRLRLLTCSAARRPEQARPQHGRRTVSWRRDVPHGPAASTWT